MFSFEKLPDQKNKQHAARGPPGAASVAMAKVSQLDPQRRVADTKNKMNTFVHSGGSGDLHDPSLCYSPGVRPETHLLTHSD